VYSCFILFCCFDEDEPIEITEFSVTDKDLSRFIISGAALSTTE